MYPSVQSDEMNRPWVFAVFDIYIYMLGRVNLKYITLDKMDFHPKTYKKNQRLMPKLDMWWKMYIKDSCLIPLF